MDEVGMAMTWATKVMANTRIRMVHVHSATKPRCSVRRFAGCTASAAFGLVSVVVPMNEFQRSAPARAAEEVLRYIQHMTQVDGLVGKLVRRRSVRPVYEQRLAHDIAARHESPVAAVERGVAVIAHGEILARWHHQLAIHDVILKHVPCVP